MYLSSSIVRQAWAWSCRLHLDLGCGLALGLVLFRETENIEFEVELNILLSVLQYPSMSALILSIRIGLYRYITEHVKINSPKDKT